MRPSASSPVGHASAGEAGSALVPRGMEAEAPGQPLGPMRITAFAGLGLLLLAGAGWLWARHGGTVFFDTLTAGLGTCL